MKKKLTFYCFLLITNFIYSQKLDYKQEKYLWPNASPSQAKQSSEFLNEDLVVIDEEVELHLVPRAIKILSKNCIVKVNTEKGVQKLKSISLPESFDIGADKKFHQLDREKRTQAPYIYKFKITRFAARVLKQSGVVIEMPMSVKTSSVFWLEENGNRMESTIYAFALENISVGDVLEYNYSIEFDGRYGYNLFFFNGEISKQNSSFLIKYSPVQYFENNQIVYSGNGADSALTKSFENDKLKTICKYEYNFKNLKSNNYSVNSCAGINLPYVFIDLNFITFIGYSTIPTDALVYKDRGQNFEWLFMNNLFVEKANYDKQHASVRKFLTHLPNDETNPDKSAFLAKLCDTLNTLKYVSAESMNYGDEAQYAVSSGEWLMKGKIIEEFMFQLYWQLLDESKMPKNLICIEDKRLGEHSVKSRTTYKYERNIIGVANGKTILYIMPRVGGRIYNLDEIPFYLEGVTAAIMNFDVQEVEFSKLISSKVIQFIKTPSSSENENVRTENGTFKVNLDSNVVNATIKENLNGQFSTIVRHYYLKNPIDSTVSALYFKKCTDKPNANAISITKTYEGKTFPFKTSFLCSEKINFSTPNEISMKNWFSFTFNKELVPEKPHFDYYFDFRYSDMYNYMIEFNKAAEITNVDSFNKSIHNTYFDLSSKLTKQTETTYLLSVMVKVKEPLMKVEDTKLLMDFVNELSDLNNLSLKLK